MIYFAAFVYYLGMILPMKTLKGQARQIAHILKRADFLRIAAAGRKWVTPAFIIQVADIPSPVAGTAEAAAKVPTCRLGLTITKKIFKSAVDRNRVRRRLRSMIIDVLAIDPPKLDIVVIARTPALKSERSVLEKDLKWALKRLSAAPKGGDGGRNDVKSL